MPGKPIRNTLTAVTAALIGVPAVHAEGLSRSETSILIYSEKDRTRAVEATFSLSKELKSQYLLDLRLTYDGLTGATPTGAAPSKYPQTLTRASGGQTVNLGAGEFPQDKNFGDTRFAADGAISRRVWKETLVKIGTHLSSEHDYNSIGLNATVTHDFNRRNTTVGLGGSISRDVVKPVTGFYEPFNEVGADLNEDATERRLRFQGRSKKVYDVVFSLAQVIDKRTVVRFSYSNSNSSGYLTDPYKIFSVVESADSADPGEPIRELYENRPDSRLQQVAFAEIRKMILGSATAISYRFYWDDWKIRSHTIDLSFNVNLKRKGMLTPRVRLYHQSAAEFYLPFIQEDQTLPQYASADYRLSEFNAVTLGLGHSIHVNPTSKLNVSLEYYLQRGNTSPPQELSSYLNYDMFPKLDVVMVRVGYAHEFF